MDDFTIAPPLVIKDTPKPRRLTTLKEGARLCRRGDARGPP